MTDLSEFLGPAKRVLIISACSAKKQTADLAPDAQLTAQELDDPILRAEGEARLARYAAQACQLYRGEGHKLVRSGVQKLRQSGYGVSHYILSAGYGLISEDAVIVPYNVSFSDMSSTNVKIRGQRLSLRSKLTSRAENHDRLIIILGRKYLQAIGLPIEADGIPRTLIYVAPSLAGRVGSGITSVPVGQVEAGRIGAYSTYAKEMMFQWDVPERQLELRTDDN
jgi:hypothetical protein